MSELELKCEVRQIVREAQNLLSTTSDPSTIIKTLDRVKCLLPGKTDSNSQDFNIDRILKAKEEFCSQHYVRFCEFLLQTLSLDWFGKLSKQDRRQSFDVFFLEGVDHASLMILCSAVQNTTYQLNKSVLLLEDFIKLHRIKDLIWTQCRVVPGEQTVTKTTQSMLWDRLITLLSTLSNRMANKLQTHNSDVFYPQVYFKILAKDTLLVLYNIYKEIKASRDCVVSFVSKLLGKVCVHGYTDLYLSSLLPTFIQLTENDFIWCRICCTVITGVPERCLEPVIEYVLQHTPWFGMVSKLLGDSVLSNQKLSYILTHKCLLLCHYEKELILRNIIGYLADAPQRRPLLIKVSDSSTVLIRKLLGGMQCHLDSPIMKVRRLGMIVAESLTQAVDHGDTRLKFEYQSDDETELLLSLLKPAVNPGVEQIESLLTELDFDEEAEEDVCGEENSDRLYKAEDETLDSDDDLQPYDMSHDVKVNSTKSPMYIRDCMQGLINQDDPDRLEACIKVAEKLVRDHPHTLQEVCVEFLKLLLHLQDNFAIDNFRYLRHSAMVAIGVQCPVQVADYLTAEFYSRNYNLRQRMDMLEVLAAAAQELSEPVQMMGSSKGKSSTAVSSGYVQQSDSPTHWKDIVQQRIERKTRRFAKGTSKPEPIPVANRFSPVAGHFFFPLLKNYDSRTSTLSLLDQDYLLLGRLLYTLGVVMYAAINSTICRHMASSLLEFIWVLRYHTEPFVRQALLFALSMIILSVPSHLLVSDLQTDVMECRLWLQDIIEKDPDTECKKLSLQTLMILENAMKKELEGVS
ncbi:telomere length regulation protein TEL2 homolog [Saccoglossus kowalevskii]